MKFSNANQIEQYVDLIEIFCLCFFFFKLREVFLNSLFQILELNSLKLIFI